MNIPQIVRSDSLGPIFMYTSVVKYCAKKFSGGDDDDGNFGFQRNEGGDVRPSRH